MKDHFPDLLASTEVLCKQVEVRRKAVLWEYGANGIQIVLDSTLELIIEHIRPFGRMELTVQADQHQVARVVEQVDHKAIDIAHLANAVQFVCGTDLAVFAEQCVFRPLIADGVLVFHQWSRISVGMRSACEPLRS
jgi:hypothetical protein